jgi:hypothetical protein
LRCLQFKKMGIPISRKYSIKYLFYLINMS